MSRILGGLCLMGIILTSAPACSCTPAADLVPDSTALSSPTASPTEEVHTLVRDAAQDLILQANDLPAGFQTVTAEESEPGAYTAFYVQTDALTGEGDILAVVVSLTIHDDAEEANEAFASEADLDQESLAAAMGAASEDATIIDVASHPVQLEAVSEAVAFRAHYEIGPLALIDYRYRFVIGNAVANVVVTAPAGEGGHDPTGFAEQAQEIAAEQASRLVVAAR